MKKQASGWLKAYWLLARQLLCGISLFAVVLGGMQAWAADGLSPASPAFLRWQKTHRLNRTLRPAVTNVQNKARSRLASPEQSEPMDETGLVPTVFNAAYLGNINRSRVRGVDSAFPAKYDLRAEGWVSPVKNQSPYGTCWAHATYASLESALMKSAGLTLDFSENNLANLHGGDWDFDRGGNGDLASAYLLRWSGPVLESSDPYPNIGGSTAMQAFRHVQNVYWILPKKVYMDNDGIKDALMKYGALYVSYYHDAGWYNAATASYYFNIVQKEDDGSRANNHAVAIVGWDDDYPRSNFKVKPPANGAYLVKNSMGSAWGDEGYFYVSYFDESFAWNRLYAFSNAEPVSNYDAIYQHDTLGLVNSAGWGERPTWGASIFTATNTSPIAAVGFYALVPETSYTIQIYTGCRADNPTSGAKALEQIGQTDCAGYVTVPLQNAVGISRNQKFSVVLKLTTPGYGAPLACEYVVPGYSSAATAAAGETFASLDGEDWRDFTKFNGTASFCCKAYTRPASSPQGKTLTALVIDGVVSVRSGKSGRFTCRARYSDGTMKDVTESARWSIIEGGEYARVAEVGKDACVVSAMEIRDRQIVRLYAEYTDGGVMQSDVWPFYVTYAAPLAPKGLAATQGSETTCVRLHWDATEDTASYAIYRGETDQSVNAEYIGDAGANLFDDTRAVPGVKYHYFVKAKNSSGSSPFSDGAMGWRALSAPENVVAGNGTSLDYVEVTWSEAAGASYYCVYRAEDLDDEPVPISGWQMSLSYRDRDASPGQTYLYYVVAAVDAQGGMASGFGLFDDGRRAVPIFPKSLEINGEASVASGDASSYACKVTYTDESIRIVQPSAWLIAEGGVYATVTPSGLLSTVPVAANQTIALRADYVEKNIQLTTFKTITVRATKPSAPLAVSTTSVTEQGITISWSVNTASSPALAYRIHRMAAGGDLILLATVVSEATAYTDQTATPGVTYTYRVSAVNGAGEGPVSAASATETVPLAAPNVVVASNGDYFDKVAVSWRPVTGATHYKVFRARSRSSADAVEMCDWQTGTSYEDVQAEPGLRYWYFVRAASDNQGRNAGGFGSGDEGWRREVPVLDSISVSGAPKLAPGGSAVYSCVATYMDGDRQPVKPQWTVEGPATVDESGRLQVAAVTSSATLTLTARYAEGSVERTATKTMTVIVPVKATANVKNVTVAPRWPFNGTVDVDYEVETSPDGTLAAVSVSGYDYDHNLALAALALEGDGSSGSVSPGRHRLSWNVAADHPRLHVRSFGVEMSAVPVPVLIPTNVTATAGTSTEAVDLSWSAVDEALSYEIWRSATDLTNDAVRVEETYNLNYSDTNAVSGTQYHYWIRSVSAEGLSDFGESVLGWRAYPDIGVIFDGNGGTTDEVWSRLYEPEKIYGVLPSASRRGYAFEGWYTAADGGDEITVTSIVPISPITLYAHWKANSYAIRFNPNSGVGSMSDLPMVYDVLGVLPPCSFSRTGYTFAGWSRSGNGSVECMNETSVKNLTEVNGTTVELFAIWNPIVPAAPTNVVATDRVTTDGIRVSWQGVADATEYRIYRTEMDSADNSVHVGSTSDTTWLDTACETGKTYYYRVKSYRSDNNQESGFSTAVWGRRRYADITCAFNGNGGTATSSAKQYTPTFAYGELPSAAKTGYTLAGWFTASVGGSEVVATNEVPTADLTLYAHWTPNSYAVHFDANGGSGTMNDQTMTYDREVALTANKFIRTAYTFGGWATSATGSRAYIDGASVKNLVSENEGSITLYAIWNPIPPGVPENVRAANRESADGILVTWSAVEHATEYRVFRDEDANCLNPQQIGVATGMSYLDTACVAGKTYFYWLKAFRSDNGTDSMSFSSPAAEGRRRYSNVTISFNGNGGTPGTPSKSATPEFAYGELPTATRTYYTFNGWWTAANGGTQVTAASIVPTSNTTLWAHWTANTYTVTYAPGKYGIGQQQTDSKTTDVPLTLKGAIFTTEGHRQNGWSTANPGVKEYELGGAYTANASITLYPSWAVNTYTIRFNANGGTGSMADMAMQYAVSKNLSSNAFARVGYAFAGWATNSTGSVVYTDGQSVTNLTVDHNVVVTLYAKWTVNEYTVTLDKQSGSGGTASVTATYGSAMPQITPPTRTGYTFGGYYTETNGNGTQYYNASGASARNWDKTSATTLYAKWTANTYTVTFDMQGGSGGTTSVTATYASAMPQITVPTRTNYTFGGYWSGANGSGTQYYNASGTGVRTWDRVSATTLYAKWTPISYTISFNANGGTGTMADLPMTYGVAKNLTNNAFTRAGYAFSGWATNAAGNVVYANGASVSNLTSTAGATVNLYAAWTLSAPTGVTATSDSTAGVTVSWTASDAATSYDIWRSTNGVSQATKLGTATTASYSDTSASPGVLYTYWVAVVNPNGTSGKSSPATGVRKLTAPTGLTSTTATDGPTIKWSAVEGATGYVIYRSTSNDSSTMEQLTTTLSTQWRDEGGYPGRNYYYRIVATCDTCQSALSEAILSYKQLAAPGNLRVIRYSSSYTTYLVTFNGVTGANNYRIIVANGAKTTTISTTSWGFDLWGNDIPRTYVQVYAIGENGQQGAVAGANSN